MIKVSKKQRDYLVKNGIYEDEIHHTHGHYKKYYATASPRVLELLYNFEHDKIIDTKTK